MLMTINAILIDWPLNVCSRAHLKINTRLMCLHTQMERNILLQAECESLKDWKLKVK